MYLPIIFQKFSQNINYTFADYKEVLYIFIPPQILETIPHFVLSSKLSYSFPPQPPTLRETHPLYIIAFLTHCFNLGVCQAKIGDSTD